MDTKINLCDTCTNNSSFPECMPDPDEIEFGDGPGNDTVIKCKNYDEE